jgi:pimeloyl-ACP methyl ester carboxylesterase
MWEQGSVTSADGTTIGFRRYGGGGPALVLVHGGAQAAQNLGRLAEDLARDFTVYVPDRRGRGASGPAGDGYGLTTEREDLAALVQHSGARQLFGLSSGGLIVLSAARTLPDIRRIAIFEPPLSIDHSTPLGWVPRYERELAAGNLAGAIVTAVRGTGSAGLVLRLVPRPLLAAVMTLATRPAPAGPKTPDRPSARRTVKRALLWPLRRASRATAERAADQTVPLRDLVPTMGYDARLVAESEGTLADYASLTIPVLLLGGTRSAAYLRRTLQRLGRVLPNATTVVLDRADHLAADNSGEPHRVATELRGFFQPDP